MQESVGLRIRLARTRRGMRQAELAKQIGISRNAMSLIEKGTSDPAFSRVQKIAEVLKTSLDYLGGRKEQDTERLPIPLALVGTDA
jgi:transcriptional regulator with XRE-family HTH domain